MLRIFSSAARAGIPAMTTATAAILAQTPIPLPPASPDAATGEIQPSDTMKVNRAAMPFVRSAAPWRCHRLLKRQIHQDQSGNDDGGSDNPPAAEFLAEEQGAHERREEDRGLAQGGDIGHRAEAERPDGDAVAERRDDAAGATAPPLCLEIG